MGSEQQGLQARPVLWLHAVFDRGAEQPSALPESWKQSQGAHLRGSASGLLATQLHTSEELGSSVNFPQISLSSRPLEYLVEVAHYVKRADHLGIIAFWPKHANLPLNIWERRSVVFLVLPADLVCPAGICRE